VVDRIIEGLALKKKEDGEEASSDSGVIQKKEF